MSELNRHIERFLRNLKAKRSDSTARHRRSHLKQFQQWAEENDLEITSLSKLDVQDHLFDMDEEGYAGSTIKGRYDSINTFYDFLTDNDTISENPAESIEIHEFSSVKKGTEKSVVLKEDVYYISPEEKEQLCENVPSPKIRNELLVRLLWQTGLRQSEVANIRIDDLDRQEREIKIRGEKTHTNRTVYYQPSLDFLMDQWIDGGYRSAFTTANESPYLFLSHVSEKLSKSQVNTIVTNTAKEARIQEAMYEDHSGNTRWKITSHTLRHSFAVQSVKNGMSVRMLSELLGHENIQTTKIYLRVANDDLKKSVREHGAGTEKIEDSSR